MSLRPSAIVEERNEPGGLFVVIDDPDTEGVLLIPCSFGHRQVLTREQYDAEDRFDVYPSQPSSRDEEVRERLKRRADEEQKAAESKEPYSVAPNIAYARAAAFREAVNAFPTTSGGER